MPSGLGIERGGFRGKEKTIYNIHAYSSVVKGVVKMMTTRTIRNWLSTVDAQGERLGWKNYKDFRAHMLNKLKSEDREDILDYLEDYED